MKALYTSIVCFCAVLGTSLAQAEAPVQNTSTSGKAMTVAAQKFLESLTADQRKQATMAFDDPARRDWHNIPKPARKGLQIREMTQPQRELCHDLLQAGLSDSGYEKAVRIMSLENNLLVGEKGMTGTPFRDPERYFLTIFGTPDDETTWGWSFEGHHLSLNFVIAKDQVQGDSPSFWGANPATVKVLVEGGPAVGVRTLADEEQLAFDLLHALTPEQLAKAVIADKAPADYRAAGQPEPPRADPPEGLAAAEMTAAQQQTLWALLKAYNSHLADDIYQARLAELESDGLDAVTFAWLGATQPGVGHSYRVQGPDFVLELINVQSDPAGNPANHIHSVWRSLVREFGDAAQ